MKFIYCFILILTILTNFVYSFPQMEMDSTLYKEIKQLKIKNDSLSSVTQELVKEYNLLKNSHESERIGNLYRQMQIDSLSSLLKSNNQQMIVLNNRIDEKLSNLIKRIKNSTDITDEKISSLDESISKTTLYWIIAILIVLLLGMLGYWFLRKKLFLSQSNLLTNIETVRNELESESLRLDEKLIKILENQLDVQNQSQKSSKDSEVDHSLALKVADEIIRIEKNISRMDEGTKGLKQLIQAVNRIKDNFASNGYEIVDMIGKEYDEGMKVSANFRIDPALSSDKRIISRIIKPQVNYNGIMIQSAQVEVSQGE